MVQRQSIAPSFSRCTEVGKSSLLCAAWCKRLRKFALCSLHRRQFLAAAEMHENRRRPDRDHAEVTEDLRVLLRQMPNERCALLREMQSLLHFASCRCLFALHLQRGAGRGPVRAMGATEDHLRLRPERAGRA